ncbi:hypothetical protein GCM10028806_34280 [Spirosoma terrae]|uniref:Uncharacterized protein n=1 Tax=Spirosoma terrae TaxID=1968276 RepID=A0A6L9L9D2_9BACT|nr:hypothetical protein [Spirosoma terrae]NDU95741.1 hypothetical protein [Spirosoma terrae]
MFKPIPVTPQNLPCNNTLRAGNVLYGQLAYGYQATPNCRLALINRLTDRLTDPRAFGLTQIEPLQTLYNQL